MTKNEPHFDKDLARGLVGEDLLDTIFAEIDGKKIEVKTDYRTQETGNLYIETWSYRQYDESDKTVSGINITQSEWWAQASPDGDAVLIIKT